MTALAEAPVSVSGACPARGDDACAKLLKEDILASIGWDPGTQVLAPPAGNLLFGRGQCGVTGCEHVRTTKTGLCGTCGNRWKRQPGGISLEEFLLIPRAGRAVGIGDCAVPGCPRPWKSRPSRLCATHDMQRRTIFRLPVDLFVAHPEVVPLPAS